MPIPEGFTLDDKKDAAAIQVPEGFTIDAEGGMSAPKQETSLLRRAGDVGISALKGAIALPESVVGIADIVTGGRVGQAAEAIGYRPAEARAILDTLYSPAQQEANANVQAAEGFVPTIQASLQNPSTIAHAAIESAPSMLGGAGMARGILKAAPKVAPLIAGAIGEGSMAAGATAERVRQQTADGRLTPKQAMTATASGVATGALGVVGGKIAQKLGITDIDTFLASGAPVATKKNALRAVFEGVIAEGAFEELPQSAQEQAAQNVALGRPAGEGVAEAAASGLLVGGVMGGGGNLVAQVANRGMAPAPVPAGPLSRAVANADPAEVIPPEPSLSEMVTGRRGAERGMSAPAKETATTPSVKYRPFNAVTSRPRKGMAAPTENVAPAAEQAPSAPAPVTDVAPVAEAAPAAPNFTLQGGIVPEVVAPEPAAESAQLPQPVIDTAASDVVTRSKPAPSSIGEMVGKSRQRGTSMPANDGVAPAEAPAPLKGLEPRQLSSLEKNANRTPAMEQRYQELKGRKEAQAPEPTKGGLAPKNELYGSTVTVYHGSPSADIDYMDKSRGTGRQSFFPTQEQAGGWVGAKNVYAVDINVGDLWDYRDPADAEALAKEIHANNSKGDSYEKILGQITKGNAAMIERGSSDWLKNNYSTYTTNEQGSDAIHQFKGGQKAKLVSPPSPPISKEATEQGKGDKRTAVTTDKHPGNGSVVTDEKGNEYLVMMARNSIVNVAPIVDGKAQVNADSIVSFNLNPDFKPSSDATRTEPLYQTGRNYYEEQEKAKTAPVAKATVETPAPEPADPTATRRAILTRLSSPKRLKDRLVQSLAADHGKEIVNALVKEGMVRFPGQGRAEITKVGADWLLKNPEPVKVKAKRTAPKKEAVEPKPEPVETTAPQKTPRTFDDYTPTAHKELITSLRNGEAVSPEDVQAAFVSLRSKEQEVKAALNAETKDALLKRLSGFRAARYRSDKKDTIVRAVYDDMVSDFAYFDGSDSLSYSMGEKIADVVQRRVDGLTPEKLAKYAERAAAQRAESKKWMESKLKALKSPETWQEFQDYLAMNKGSLAALTPEQKKLYDELHAEQNKKAAAQAVERKADVRQAAAQVDAEIVETKHTKTGEPLFVVKAAERVEKDVYNQWNATAKRLGGWYSSYGKDGAVRGFQFKTMENAEAFQKYLNGETDAVKETIKERIETKQETRKSAAAERLTELADSMEGKANGVLNADRLTNTSKRAAQAESTDGAARKQVALAKTIRNIAAAIQEGEAKHLEGISAGTHVETLNEILRSTKADYERQQGISYSESLNRTVGMDDIEAAKYPYPHAHQTHIFSLAEALSKRVGGKRDSEWLKKRAEGMRGDDVVLRFKTPEDIERLEGALTKAKTIPSAKYAVMDTTDRLQKYKRLQKMGIPDLPSLRAALREYLQFKDEGPKADRAKTLERQLAGQKNVGIDFFPTPPSVAAEMVEKAGVTAGMKVLEPSAGTGNIAAALQDAGAEVDVAEISSSLRDVLDAKGFNVVSHDILDLTEGEYDAVVMNPPFSADIEHVQHAYNLLKNGGRLVAIVGEGSFGNQRKHTEFKEWLDNVGAEVEPLPAGTFTDRTQLKTTGANARLVEITKGAFFSLGEDSGGTLSPSAITRIESLISKALPEGKVTLSVVDSITPPPGSEQAFAAHGVKTGKVAGMTQVEKNLTTGEVRSIITLAMDGATEQTGTHEIFHVSENLGIITPKDLSILERAYPSRDGVASSERRADAFADYVAGRGKKPVLSAKLIFDKIRRFLDRLASVLKGEGWRTADDVFADLMEGRLKRNAKGEAAEGVQFSADKAKGAETRVLYHSSPDSKLKVTKSGRFGEFLFFGSSTGMGPGAGGHNYRIEVPKEEIIEASSLFFQEDASKLDGLVKKVMAQFSVDQEMAMGLIDQTVNVYDVADKLGIDIADISDVSYDLQKMAAQAAQKLGYRGVEVPDEHGTSWMIDMLGKESELTPVDEDGEPITTDPQFSLATAIKNRDPRALRSALTLHPKVQGIAATIMNEGANVSRWQKSVGTMYHLAEKLAAEGKPQFKAVFQKGQEFLNDISALAVAAESLAPDIFPKLGTGKGIFHYLSKKDSQAIAAPLFEGTLYGGADPIKGKVFSTEELKRIFSLNDKQIDLYRQARAAVDRSLDDMARSLIAKNAKMVKLPYDRDMDLKEMAEEISTTIQERIDDMQAELDQYEANHEDRIKELSGKELKEAQQERDKFVKPQQAAIDRHKSAVENVKEIARKTTLLKSRGYFPLMRFGDMTVTVKEDGKTIFFGMYESTYKAKQAEMELAKQYPKATVTMAPMGREKYKLYGGMNLEALQLFAEHLDAEEAAPYQEYLKVGMNNRSAMKRLIHRKGTEGYSEDAVRTLAQFIVSNARHASTQYNLNDMRRLASEIPEQEQGDVQDQAVKLYEYLSKPNEEAAKLRGYLFIHYLGGSLASGIVNMTQPIMMTAPYLSTKTSAAKVVKFMTAASKMAYTDPAKVQGALGIALRRAEADGITAPQEIHQLTAMASNKLLAANPVWNAALKGWGGFFAAAEVFNRRTTFISAFNIAKDNGKADSNAYREAIDAVTATQGVYNKGNRANWSRGIIGATAMTFKQYSVMYLELYNRLPMKQRMIMLGTLMLMAGLQGMPFAEDAEDVFDTLGQWAGYNTNSKQWMERQAKEIPGGNFLLRGVSAVLPIDLQGRMGLHNLIPGTAMLKQSSIDKGRDVAEFFGPAGGLIKSLGDTLALAATGLYGRATIAALPRAAQNIIQGAEMMATGAGHDKYGRKTVEVNAAEAAVKMTGFNPDKIAEESRVKGSNMQDMNLVRVRKNEIVNQWAYGIVNKDRAEINAALAKLKEWNEKNPDWRITNALPAAQKKAAAMRATSKDRFIKSVPKEQRRRIVDELG